MSYSKCFICGTENYSGNENHIRYERRTEDKERMTRKMVVWEGAVCDECLSEHLYVLDEEMWR